MRAFLTTDFLSPFSRNTDVNLICNYNITEINCLQLRFSLLAKLIRIWKCIKNAIKLFFKDIELYALFEIFVRRLIKYKSNIWLYLSIEKLPQDVSF